ncbi:GNAT family N-acetyltransferase [Donghicola sp. C2-DW-16]|uniref:GNAT family N-acetyltransferase n=1 Tax=Donghicola mangrovi TaxID=2729614 RepID=A0ABX2PA94_9RHOB|nr:GNAT family N-acetyltransferase [Donghicola mangrovi]NVO26381.1 GNAT family N-acetyltransferase [Donghicola mangrovi]
MDNRYFDVVDATWPPYAITHAGPWLIREGRGGGKRVSAASATGPVTQADIPQALDAMHAIGQGQLFMLRPDDTALDQMLETQGYEVIDPVHVYSGDPVVIGAGEIPRVTTFESETPLAIMQEIWAEGGIGPDRLAVMARAQGPKTYLLGRTNDRAAGVAYVAMHDGVAMLHALEVLEKFRGNGLGRHLMRAAGRWAAAQGARELTLLVTRRNVPANALYSSLGMQVVGDYHYRIKDSA